MAGARTFSALHARVGSARRDTRRGQLALRTVRLIHRAAEDDGWIGESCLDRAGAVNGPEAMRIAFGGAWSRLDSAGPAASAERNPPLDSDPSRAGSRHTEVTAQPAGSCLHVVESPSLDDALRKAGSVVFDD